MNNSFKSQLFDEKTFYPTFLQDLYHSKEEVIIESPFITTSRVNQFYTVLNTLLQNSVKIYIITKAPEQYDNLIMKHQAQIAVHNFECMGVQALLATNNHHRKLAILDRKILWEGSLNILSQNNSREIMRRIDSNEVTKEMIKFTKLIKIIS